MKTLIKMAGVFCVFALVAAAMLLAFPPEAKAQIAQTVFNPNTMTGLGALVGIGVAGMQDIHNTTRFVVAVNPQTVTNSNAAVVGAIIDTAGYDSVEFAIAAGVLGAGTGITPSFEYGDDPALADTAVIPAAELLGTIALATHSQAGGTASTVKKIGYLARTLPQKRYLRLTLTPSGNAAASVNFGAVCTMSSARTQPVP